MRVAIDALPFLGDGGITSYVSGLVRALLVWDRSNDYELLFRTWGRTRREDATRLRNDPSLARARFRSLRLPDGLVEWVWHFGGGPSQLISPALRPDVFLATLQISPWLGPGRVLPLVYDLIPLRFPEWYGLDAIRLERRLRTVARQARIWMTISEASRSDLEKFLGIPAEAVRIVYPGMDAIFRPSSLSAGQQALLDRYGIERPYVIYVGGYGAHKNVETLLKAFPLVRDKYSKRCRLVLVGPRRWARKGLEGTSGLHQDKAVFFLGYVPREDLAVLYGAAELFVSVSLYEGFGLPALEAMACGTPVVASRAGALPEVVGDAGCLVDPRDVDGIAAAISNLLEDQEARRQLAERARQRSMQYSWERAARTTQAIFAELARN